MRATMLMSAMATAVGAVSNLPANTGTGYRVGGKARKPHWKSTQSEEDRVKRIEAAEAKRIRKAIKRGERSKEDVIAFVLNNTKSREDAIIRLQEVGISSDDIPDTLVENGVM